MTTRAQLSKFNYGLAKCVDEKVGLKMVNNTVYEYDSFGRVAYQYDFNADTSRLTVDHKIYDSYYPDRVKQLQKKFNNGQFYTTREYYYDDKGRLIREDALDQSGKVIYTYITEYDNKGHSSALYLENSEGSVKKRRLLLTVQGNE